MSLSSWPEEYFTTRYEVEIIRIYFATTYREAENMLTHYHLLALRNQHAMKFIDAL